MASADKKSLSIHEQEQEAITERAAQLYHTHRLPEDEDTDTVLVQDRDFHNLVGTLDRQILPPPRNGKGAPVHALVLLEASGVNGLDGRSALAAIGPRPVRITRYPRGSPPRAPNVRRLLFGFPVGQDETAHPLVHGPETNWVTNEGPWPTFLAPEIPPWWPVPDSDKNTWTETSLIAMNADHLAAGLSNLGFLTLCWLVTLLETEGGYSWRTRGLNLGGTVALPIDGNSYFVSTDSSPQTGSYQAHFTAFERLYSDPKAAWTAAASRVRTTLAHDGTQGIFSTPTALPTDSELEAAARVMYERGYYAGTHVLTRGGVSVMMGGRPVPDSRANIASYASGLQARLKANLATLKLVLRVH